MKLSIYNISILQIERTRGSGCVIVLSQQDSSLPVSSMTEQREQRKRTLTEKAALMAEKNKRARREATPEEPPKNSHPPLTTPTPTRAPMPQRQVISTPPKITRSRSDSLEYIDVDAQKGQIHIHRSLGTTVPTTGMGLRSHLLPRRNQHCRSLVSSNFSPCHWPTKICIDRLRKDWTPPIYAFYKREVIIGKTGGRCYHTFACAGRSCKHKVNWYLDTMIPPLLATCDATRNPALGRQRW